MDWSDYRKNKEQLENALKELDLEILKEYGFPLGTAVVPNTGRLKGKKCFVTGFRLFDNSNEVYHVVRQAKKDGTFSEWGKLSHSLTRNELNLWVK